MEEEELRRKIQAYRPFYHVFRLTETIETPGRRDHVPGQEKIHRALRSLDLHGRRVLDVGCRDGLFSFESEKQGAAEVIGIDNDLSRAAVEFLIPFFKSGVQMHEMNLLDLRPQTFGAFDVVILAGVLYHLRFPFYGLKIIRDVLKGDGKLLLETAVFVDDNRFALLHCPVGSENPYDRTCPTLFNLKGLTDTLLSLGFQVEQVELQLGGLVTVDTRDDATAVPPHPGFDPASHDAKTIDRVVLVAKRVPALDNPKLTRYWEGIHDLHTVDINPWSGERPSPRAGTNESSCKNDGTKKRERAMSSVTAAAESVEYVTPWEVTDLEKCSFYHMMDLPGVGTVGNTWDLRKTIGDYLGRFDFSGKKVLDVGAASGYLTFEMERRGASVTSFDIKQGAEWNCVPYANPKFDRAELIGRLEWHIPLIKGAYWFAHRVLESKAKAYYGNIYDFPAALGDFDVVNFGMVLPHLRDPFLALQSASRLSRKWVVVTQQSIETSEPIMRFFPEPETLCDPLSWWHISEGCMEKMLGVLGFEVTSKVRAKHFCVIRDHFETCTAFVARRIHEVQK